MILILDYQKRLYLLSLFINFIQPSKSADLEKISRNENNLRIKSNSLKISNFEILKNILNSLFRKDLEKILFEKNFKSIKINSSFH